MNNDRITSLPSISVLVPVYNSEGSLPELIERLENVLLVASNRFEVILVNDGSRDGSWDVICQLAQAHDYVHGIDLMRNYGQHNALLCAIRMAKNDIIVTIDDDLQNPPEEIPKLLDKLAEGYDVVYGTPQKEQHGLWRDLASQLTKLALQSTMGAKTARKVTSFRVFRTGLRDAFAQYLGPFVLIDALLTWATTQFATVPVRHEPRRVGVSNYTFRMLITHAINMITGFTTLPLQLASMIGFLFTLLGIVILVYVLIRYLIEGGSVPGFAFLASIIAIFSGAQLFALGIIGEYLARMHFRSMGRPSSIIRSSVGLSPNNDGE